MRNPITTYNTITKSLDGGAFLKPHRFCQRVFNAHCINHYNKNMDKEGIVNCPYGFSSVIKKINEKKRVYTSLNLEKISNRRELKSKVVDEEKKLKISLNDLNGFFEWIADIDGRLNASQNIIQSMESNSNKVEQKREILDDTLHELRKLNNQLKKQAFILNKDLEEEMPNMNNIEEKAKNVLSTSQLISVRLNAYDFTLNPGLVEIQKATSVNIYKKFEKARHCLNLLAEEQKVEINLLGTCHSKNDMYEIFDILPFILLENAIKFTPKNEKISVSFEVLNNNLRKIKVSNPAVLPKKDEIKRLMDKGVRGEATANQVSGTGKGLYIAKLICDYNNIKISIDSEFVPGRINSDGMFHVVLEF